MTRGLWNILRTCWGKPPPGRPAARPRAATQLRLEALEGRDVPSTLTVVADADASVSRARANSNFGDSSELRSDLSPASATYLHFTLDGASGPITSAKVRVHVTDGSSNGPAIYAASNDWSERGLTWNNRPDRLGGPLDNKGRVGTGWLEYDVSPVVNANGSYSFTIAADSADGLYMSARERAGYAPQLVVTFADGTPPAPTEPPVTPPTPTTGVGQQWSSPRQVGTLDTSQVDEASGLAVSRAYADRLYHINDSGDGGYFYITNGQGQATQRVRINGFSPSDAEDLAYGTWNGKNYLIVGDIGDNGASRSSITLVFIEERAVFGSSVDPSFKVTVKYPDGAHNAEAMAFHPNGDIYFLTKESTSRVYRLSAAQWQNAGGQTQTLQYVGTFSLASKTGSSNITALDISPDGSRLLVLTYNGALELQASLVNGVLDFSRYGQSGGPAYKVIPLTRLSQQESAAYLPNGVDFLYTTEDTGAAVPILVVERLL